MLKRKSGLIAPRRWWSLTPLQRKNISNGCGPLGYGWLVPDTMWGVNVSAACDIHDYCYQIGVPFDWANAIMLYNTLQIVNDRSCSQWSKNARILRCCTYYTCVNSDKGKSRWLELNGGDESYQLIIPTDEYADLIQLKTLVESAPATPGKVSFSNIKKIHAAVKIWLD